MRCLLLDKAALNRRGLLLDFANGESLIEGIVCKVPISDISRGSGGRGVFQAVRIYNYRRMVCTNRG